MSTEIKAWEIIDGKPTPLEANLATHGRTEQHDLEQWLANDPSIIRPGLLIIGRQVSAGSGRLDLLAVDRSGDLVIIELKRDQLPREALVQAIDYASDIAAWGVDKISEECAKYTRKSLEEMMSEAFPDLDLENLTVNESQRIILVGFSIDQTLERMIQWLSDQSGMSINAVVLKYVRTSSGSELLTRSAVISEQVEVARAKTAKKFTIPMSDEPGDYDDETLRELLHGYFIDNPLQSAEIIRDVLLPACLRRPIVSREEFKNDLVAGGAYENPSKAGLRLTVISIQLGMEKNDFLRQVIGYDYPNYPWEKDGFFVREGYREMVEELVREKMLS